MPVWVRDPSNRLVRVEPEIMSGNQAPENPAQPELSLRDRCYPTRSSLPTCFRLPAVLGTNYEIKPQYINMLPKFHGLDTEDAYVFVSDFQQICLMMRLQTLSEDSVKLRLIPFALKDGAKQWLLSLAPNSISTWDEFQRIFLKKYYPNHKTAKIRSDIYQFRHKAGEPFWKYFDRFKNLLILCPHHGIDKWKLCQIIYDGLDFQQKALLESMCQGKFLDKEPTAAWDYLEEWSEQTIQWENIEVSNQQGGCYP